MYELIMLRTCALIQRCPTLSLFATCGNKHNFFNFIITRYIDQNYNMQDKNVKNCYETINSIQRRQYLFLNFCLNWTQNMIRILTFTYRPGDSHKNVGRCRSNLSTKRKGMIQRVCDESDIVLKCMAKKGQVRVVSKYTSFSS